MVSEIQKKSIFLKSPILTIVSVNLLYPHLFVRSQFQTSSPPKPLGQISCGASLDREVIYIFRYPLRQSRASKQLSIHATRFALSLPECKYQHWSYSVKDTDRSLDRGNESLFATSGSHDQDGRHAHIWGKKLFKKFLHRNHRTDFHKT